ncbi:aminotransferase class III-fold pyridoxal phosphate-dependent enzyme [Sandaracinobacter neustonicus]|uniref:Aminotransferase class III-fold pyridoxal phosphate-dependent enzyme n=1 Tax=Sandaracinobacter neustonicus TaxID=1715348 RepID=A0A501XL32_9SPHN|nr:aminotransferase class III-fold pyridoxal phosphate-dependent enzyme [Sandaracinobacter neustonicus]TPE60984.1 aminotransferase class III-fold pyridoxal phosphate-dependent enzyme [Sandaracinobacter neustonicus]
MSTSPIPNDLSAYWLPFTANKAFKAAPRLITGAKGQFYTTADGRTVRDGFSGLWCSILGHGHPLVTEAIIRQAQALDYSPAFNFATPAAFELASRVAAQFPAGLEHVFFTNSGSEAVDTALKMALTHHRARGEGTRTRFIGRVNGYHGVGFGGLSVGGMANNRKFFGPGLPGVDHLPFPYDPTLDAFTRGEPQRDPMLYLKELEAIIALHDASTIAAVIVEPMIGSAGVFIPPAGYLQKLREISERHGILLILDEVITGFGRLGAANGASFFGITPDLCTMAKGINNAAIPMGAVIASRQIYDTILNATPTGVEFFHGYTYSAHPLAVAAGLATQQAIHEEGLYEHVARLAPLFEEMLHSLRGEPYVTDIRNLGLAGGLTLAPHPDGPGLRGYQLFVKAYELGVAIRSNGDTIAIAPILNSNEEDIAQVIELVRRALRALA